MKHTKKLEGKEKPTDRINKLKSFKINEIKKKQGKKIEVFK